MSFLTNTASRRMQETPSAETSVVPRRLRPTTRTTIRRRIATGAGALAVAAIIGSVGATTASAAPASHGSNSGTHSCSRHYSGDTHQHRHHWSSGDNSSRSGGATNASYSTGRSTGTSGSGAAATSSSSAASSSSSTASSSSSSRGSTSTSAVNADGLSSNTVAVINAIKAKYPQVTFITEGSQDHLTGHAVDIMIPNSTTASGKALGDEIAAYLKANYSTFNIHYLIWQQKIWNIQRDSEGWRSMEDRGSATANHYDHVHVSVY